MDFRTFQLEEVPSQTMAIQNTLDELIGKNYDHTTKKWSPLNNGIYDYRFTRQCQLEVSRLKNKLRILQENILAVNGSNLDTLKYGPLLSRQLWIQYHPAEDQKEGIAKEWLVDGEQFTFSELDEGPRHTVGNWDCKACLNLGSEINSAQDVNSALTNGKATEWCPNFHKYFRNEDIKQYIELWKHHGPICYAGLLHTEMSFSEDIFYRGENLSYMQLDKELLEANKDLIETKHYIVITKKCDTCGFTIVEKKEYTPPEELDNSSEVILDQLPNFE